MGCILAHVQHSTYLQLLPDEVTSTTRPIYGSCEKPQPMSQHIFILVGGCFAELRRAEVEVVTERKLLIFRGDLTTIIIFHKTHQCFIQVQTLPEYSECLLCLGSVGQSVSLHLLQIEPSQPNEEPYNHSLLLQPDQGWEAAGCAEYQSCR